jgi:hypothetical protein
MTLARHTIGLSWKATCKIISTSSDVLQAHSTKLVSLNKSEINRSTIIQKVQDICICQLNILIWYLPAKTRFTPS